MLPRLPPLRVPLPLCVLLVPLVRDKSIYGRRKRHRFPLLIFCKL
jgi:hypothetical protein